MLLLCHVQPITGWNDMWLHSHDCCFGPSFVHLKDCAFLYIFLQEYAVTWIVMQMSVVLIIIKCSWIHYLFKSKSMKRFNLDLMIQIKLILGKVASDTLTWTSVSTCNPIFLVGVLHGKVSWSRIVLIWWWISSHLN